MRRGDIVRVELPRPAGAAGYEQFGFRPAIVIQDDLPRANLLTTVVVPLTSNQAAARFSGSFILTPSATNGLTAKSVVLTHQVRAIDKNRIRDTIGTLGDQDLAILEKELRKLLGL